MDKRYFVGVDIGSTTIKIVISDKQDQIVGETLAPSGSLFQKSTLDALHALLNECNLNRREIAYMVSTGYGRKLFKDADETISEITANAVGAQKLGCDNGNVRTIINIGGQDLKVIRLDEDGHVENFAMNDKCAAGTGRFLEVIARNMDMEVDELGTFHLNSQGVPATINSTCTVFAESEIIGLLASGKGKEEIIAGIHYSIARRVARLAMRLGVEDTVFFDGGPALNSGLRTAMEDELMRDIVVPERPQMTTAYGAALIARDVYENTGENAHAA